MAYFAAIDWNALANQATDALSSRMGDIVQGVRLETAYLPPMDLVGGTGGIGTSPTGAPTFDLGAFLRPKLTVQLAAGGPIVYAPYGDPGEGSWLPLIAVSAAMILLAYRAGQRSRR